MLDIMILNVRQMVYIINDIILNWIYIICVSNSGANVTVQAAKLDAAWSAMARSMTLIHSTVVQIIMDGAHIEHTFMCILYL